MGRPVLRSSSSTASRRWTSPPAPSSSPAGGAIPATWRRERPSPCRTRSSSTTSTGRHLPVAQDRQADARTLLATGLRELAEETGLVADPELLLPWDRWVTPEGSPKRFDVSFFVLPVPREHARQPAHLTTEAVGSEWTAVHSLLDAGESGDLRVMTPTRVILRELLDLGTVAEVVRRRPVITGVRDDRPSARPRASDPV